MAKNNSRDKQSQSVTNVDGKGVRCDAELMALWLEGVHDVELSSKLLYDLQCVLRYYGDILVTNGDVVVEYPEENKSTQPSADPETFKVRIPVNGLAEGKVDDTIAVTVHELLHLEHSPNFETTLKIVLPILQEQLQSIKIIKGGKPVSAYTLLCNSSLVSEAFSSNGRSMLPFLEDDRTLQTVCQQDLNFGFLVELVSWIHYAINVVEDLRVDALQPPGTVKYYDKFLDKRKKAFNPEVIEGLFDKNRGGDPVLGSVSYDALTYLGFDTKPARKAVKKGAKNHQGIENSDLFSALSDNCEADILPFDQMVKMFTEQYADDLQAAIAAKLEDSAAMKKEASQQSTAISDFLKQYKLGAPSQSSGGDDNTPEEIEDGDLEMDANDISENGAGNRPDSSGKNIPARPNDNAFNNQNRNEERNGNGQSNGRGDSQEYENLGSVGNAVNESCGAEARDQALDAIANGDFNDGKWHPDARLSAQAALKIKAYENIIVYDTSETWDAGVAQYSTVIVDATGEPNRWNMEN